MIFSTAECITAYLLRGRSNYCQLLSFPQQRGVRCKNLELKILFTTANGEEFGEQFLRITTDNVAKWLAQE